MQNAEHHRERFELAYATEWAKAREGDETPEQLASEVKTYREGDTYEAGFPRLRFGWEGYQWALAGCSCLAQIQEPAQPVCWIRFCSDGSTEGPIMHSQICEARKTSGAWTPLYAGAAPATVVLQREYPAINPKDFDSDSDLWCYIDAWRHSKPGKESGENAYLVCGHIQRLMRAYFDLGRKPATTAPALEAPAAPAIDVSELAISVCQRVAELPDRNSPEDWPDAMLVTIDELGEIVRDEIMQALNGSLAAAPQAQAEAQAAPVAGQCRFKGEQAWGNCSVEHVRMILQNPSKWQSYEVRYLYAAPQAPAVDAETIHLQDLKNALAECKELRQQLTLMDEQQAGTVWRWQADGQHQLDTMGNRMGVLIYACDLRALLAGAVPAVDASELEWLTKDGRAHGFRVLQAIEGAVITHSTESLRASIAAAQAAAKGDA